jgi:hypothetical protein
VRLGLSFAFLGGLVLLWFVAWSDDTAWHTIFLDSESRLAGGDQPEAD